MTYAEGSHRVTFASFRFGSLFRFRPRTGRPSCRWTSPSRRTPATAALGSRVQLRNGRLYVERFDCVWSTRVTQGAWIRMALDVRYSQDPDIGTITVYVDGNGDGDAADPGEVSPLIRTSTLKAEIAGPERRIPGRRVDPGTPEGWRLPPHDDLLPVGLPRGRGRRAGGRPLTQATAGPGRAGTAPGPRRTRHHPRHGDPAEPHRRHLGGRPGHARGAARAARRDRSEARDRCQLRLRLPGARLQPTSRPGCSSSC